MPTISADDLCERLRRDLPAGAVVAPTSLVVMPSPAHGPARDPFTTADPLIAPEHLPAAAIYLRDTLGYSFLSDLAVVDYFADGLFELVYRFYHPSGGPSLVLKTRLTREQPEIPALTPIWPGANFHEREAFDLFGIIFVGHPYLQRIYMWDEFEGFPMRRDFPRQGDKYLGDEE